MVAAIAMLLVSSILLTLASFAWLTMSVAPELRGITTNIGANGSLEIALLTTETRNDLTKIKTSVGQSLEKNVTAANNTWGNLVDLSSEAYGLSNVVLMPARLNAVPQSSEGYVVNSGMLSVPTYGYDGRIIELTDDTVSAIYGDSSFSYILGEQDYGVRVIGTSSSITVQGSALAMAKSNIITYTNSAKSHATSAMENNGDAIMGLVIAHSANTSATYDDSDIDVLESMIAALNTSVNYIDLALRQALVAYAAATIADEETFEQVRDTITSGMDLSSIKEWVSGNFDVPRSFIAWIEEKESIQNDLNAASNECTALSGGEYTWIQIRAIMDKLMSLDGIYIGESKFTDMKAADIMALAGTNFKMTLAPGSGVFADIADFTGDFSSWISVMGSDVEISTVTQQNPAYLAELASVVRELDAVDGSGSGSTKVDLTSTYGYALDMAFRCNAPLSELLLQTEALQRIYEDSFSASTMGGGSYMEFKSSDKNFTFEQTIKLMDAVRVAFIDDQNAILGIAKLNTSNRITVDDSIKAPLYLYDFSFSNEDEDRGALIMGERRKFDNTITNLDRNVSKAVTVLVWLDGDIVDNTMVSAESETSLNGILNLQFASSADLVPADNNSLLNITPDKDELNELIVANKETYEAGQGLYTTVSWNEYTEAYEFAVNVNENLNANESQVYKAAKALTVAASGLEKIELSVLGNKIDEMRQLMGETTDVARYVFYDEANKRYYCTDTYTEEQKESKVGEIFRVDYHNNLRDEGDGIKTRVYTDSSWSNLAATVYDAEVVYRWNNTDYTAIDNAVTAMKTAYDALEFAVFFMPYDYNGALYYFAVSDETDTYGKWYDADLKRVVADLTILELDARAVPAEIAEIEIDEYVPNNHVINPSLEIKSEIYPNLTDEIIAVHWNTNEMFVRVITTSQRTYLQTLITKAEALGVESVEVVNAIKILDDSKVLDSNMPTEQEATAAISALEAIIAEEEAKLDQEADTSTADMTANQRTVLTLAVQSAKSVEGYDDESIANLAALRIAVYNAEEILSQTAGVTVEAANAVLDALNAELVENGKTAVTEYNTILHTLPVGSEVFEVVHNGDTTHILLNPTGEVGEAEISAVILTRNGVLMTVKKTVTVYAPAEGAVVADDQEIEFNATMTLEAVLIQNDGFVGDSTYGESIKSCTWASLDDSVITVMKNGDKNAVVTAVGVGSTTVTVTIETVQGNEYSVRVNFTVWAPIKGAVCYVGGGRGYQSDVDVDGVVDTGIHRVASVNETDTVRLELLQVDGSKGDDSLYGEAIESCAWTSLDESVVTITSDGERSAVVTYVGVGITYTTVTITTDKGNTYTLIVSVTVEPEESGE